MILELAQFSVLVQIEQSPWIPMISELAAAWPWVPLFFGMLFVSPTAAVASLELLGRKHFTTNGRYNWVNRLFTGTSMCLRGKLGTLHNLARANRHNGQALQSMGV